MASDGGFRGPRITHEVMCPVGGKAWHITVWNETLVRVYMEGENHIVLLEPRGAETPGGRKGGFKGEKDESD